MRYRPSIRRRITFDLFSTKKTALHFRCIIKYFRHEPKEVGFEIMKKCSLDFGHIEITVMNPIYMCDISNTPPIHAQQNNNI